MTYICRIQGGPKHGELIEVPDDRMQHESILYNQVAGQTPVTIKVRPGGPFRARFYALTTNCSLMFFARASLFRLSVFS